MFRALILFVAFCYTVSFAQYNVSVTTVDDVDSSNCSGFTDNCSLRGAWEYCRSILDIPCIISLPDNTTLYHDITKGPLYLEADNIIEITGNGAVVQAFSSTTSSTSTTGASSLQYFSEFPIDTIYSFYTYNNVQQYSFIVYYGSTMTFSLCEYILDLSTSSSSSIPTLPQGIELQLLDENGQELASITGKGTDCALVYDADWSDTWNWSKYYSLIITVVFDQASSQWSSVSNSGSPDNVNTGFSTVEHVETVTSGLHSSGSIDTIKTNNAKENIPPIPGSSLFDKEDDMTDMGDLTIDDLTDIHENKATILNIQRKGKLNHGKNTLNTTKTHNILMNSVSTTSADDDYASSYSISNEYSYGTPDNTNYYSLLDVKLYAFYSFHNINSQFISTSTTQATKHANLTITNLTISSFGGIDISYGGAIYIDDVYTSDDDDNYYYAMAGVVVTLSDVTFINNMALRGGALAIQSLDSVILNNIVFMNNIALYHGGSLYVEGTDYSFVTMNDITILNSYAYLGGGGGIMLYNVNGMLMNSLITDKSMSHMYGGNIAILGCSNVMITTLLSSQSMSDKGGNVYVFASSDVTITDATITQSIATSRGGVLAGLQSDHINLITWISSYTATISPESSSAYSSDKITGSGGMLSLIRSTELYLHDMILTHSTAARDGGGFLLIACENMMISDIQFTSLSSSLQGGAVLVGLSTNVTFNNIIGNSITSKSGGFMNIIKSSTIIVSNSQLSYVTAYMRGGNFVSYRSNDVVINNLNSKEASATNGGVLFCFRSNYVTFTGSTVTNCGATSYGGVVYVKTSNTIVITSNTFNNVYSPSGGFIYSYFVSGLTITTSTLYAVTGGLYFIYSNYVNLDSVTISNSIISSEMGYISFFGDTGFSYCKQLTLSNIICDGVNAYYGCIRSNYCSMLTVDGLTVTNGIGNRNTGIDMYYVNKVIIRNIYVTNANAEIGIAGSWDCNDVLIENVQMHDSYTSKQGGLNIGINTNIVIRNLIITNSLGGGVQCYACQTLTMDNIIISQTNFAVGVGTIKLEYVYDATLQYVQISNSKALQGGGIYATKSNRLHILDSIIQECSSTNEGGGIYLDLENYNVYLVNVTLLNNTAGTDGGGFYSKSENDNVFWLTRDSYNNMKMFEASTTYYQYISYDFSSAQRVLLVFDKSTVMDKDDFCCAKITVDGSSSSFTSAGYNYQLLPGVDIVPKYFSAGSITVGYQLQLQPSQHNPSTAEYNYIKLYLIPIYSSTDVSNVLKGNIAKNAGGGIMSAFANDVLLMLNTMIHSNQALASSGGGIFFKTFNAKSIISRSSFINNQAAVDKGGAIYMGSSQYSVVFEQCLFQSNSATYGGGLYISLDNGVGSLGTSEEKIFFDNCRIDSNVASKHAGGIYIEERNSIQISASSITNNQATSGDGGGMCIGTANTITLKELTVETNYANDSCGGGIAVIESSSTVSLTSSCSINGNYALGGGGICIREQTSLSVGGSLVLSNNYGREGGALLLMSTTLWTSDYGVMIDITSNSAERGSAMFLYDVPPSSKYLGYITIDNNTATEGTTVYWIADNKMSTLPFNASELSIAILDTNQVRYDQQIGTQPVYLNTSSVYYVVDYDNQLSTPITINVLDSYDHVVGMSVGSYINVDWSETHCLQTSRPYVTGEDYIYSVEPYEGTATYTDLHGVCYPEGSITLVFTMDTDPLNGISSKVVSNHELSANVTLNYRSCVDGEYISDGACTLCPNGTYSLHYEQNGTCTSCSGIDGVLGCYGSMILLEAGYWRRYDSTDQVLSCILGETSCPGGWVVGDSACNAGYVGPFCAQCDDDHYMSDGECLPCGTSSLNPGKVISIFILSVMFLVALGLAIMWFRRERGSDNDDYVPWRIELWITWVKETFDKITIKLKIIIATYQVVISAAEVLDVTLPQVYTKFTNSLNFVNLDLLQLFPLGCKFDVGYINTLLWDTLSPIGLLVIIGIAYWVERAIMLVKYDDPNDRKAIGGNLRARYLNYVFYLTYLILPSVTTTIFQLYVCKNADPSNEDQDNKDSFLVADVSISCETTYYENWKIYGYIMILVYPVGISFFYWYCLNMYKDEIMNREMFEKEEEEDKAEEEAKAKGEEEQAKAEAEAILNEDPSGNNETETDAVIQTDPMDIQVSLNSDDPSTPKPVGYDEPLPPGSSRASGAPQLLKRSHAAKVHFQHRMSKTAVRLNFLWEAYKPEYWYWELVETARRIILTAVLSICSTGSSEQNVLSIFLAFVFIKIYGYFQPYAEYSDYQMAEVGQSQVFLTYFVIIIIEQGLMNKDWDKLLEALLILVNLSVIVLGFYYESLSYAEENPDVIQLVTDASNKVAESFSAKPTDLKQEDSNFDDEEFLEKEVEKDGSEHSNASNGIEFGAIYDDKEDHIV